MVESLGVPKAIQHTSAPPRLLSLASGNTVLDGRVGGLGGVRGFWRSQSRDLDGVGSHGTL